MQEYSFPPQQEVHYIDVVTRGINTGVTGVIGKLNNFTVTVNMPLTVGKNYTVEVISFSYKNLATPLNIKPILLTDISGVIKDNNKWSSILYKSNVYTGNTDIIETDITNNINLIRPLQKIISIDTVTVQIRRSDNGEEFPFDDNDPNQVINIVFKITSL